jgi:hypothetical protein
MCKDKKIKVFESKPTIGGFEKKNLGSPKGVGILDPIVFKKVKGGKI